MPNNMLSDEKSYRASHSQYWETANGNLYIGFKIDPETDILLDVKWKATGDPSLASFLAITTDHLIGKTRKDIEKISTKDISYLFNKHTPPNEEYLKFFQVTAQNISKET